MWIATRPPPFGTAQTRPRMGGALVLELDLVLQKQQ
jgi:hypothetical protein